MSKSTISKPAPPLGSARQSPCTPEVEARMIARIQVAARLADSAVQEMLYRFFVHQKLKVRTKTKRRVSR